MVSRTKIKKLILNLLSAVSNMDIEDIHEGSYLKRDLLLSAEMIGALAITYTKISEHFGGEVVSINESKKANKVEKVIELVHEKANANEPEE